MPDSRMEPMYKIMFWVMAVFIIPWMSYLTYNQENIKGNQLNRSEIIEILTDKSEYRLDKPRLAGERQEMLNRVSNIEWKTEATSKSINDIQTNIREINERFNSQHLDLERIRFQLENLVDKKKEYENGGTSSGG